MTLYYIIPCIFGYKNIYDNWLYTILNNCNKKIYIDDYPFDYYNNTDKNIFIKKIVNNICNLCILEKENNIVLIGHSYGCHIICSLYNMLYIELNKLNIEIKKCYMLFPYIDNNKDDFYTNFGLKIFSNIYSNYFTIFIQIIYYIIIFLGFFMKIFNNVKINHIKVISNMIYNIYSNNNFENNFDIINTNNKIFEIIYCNDIYCPDYILNKCNVNKHFINTKHCFMFDHKSFNYINNIIFK